MTDQPHVPFEDERGYARDYLTFLIAGGTCPDDKHLPPMVAASIRDKARDQAKGNWYDVEASA